MAVSNSLVMNGSKNLGAKTMSQYMGLPNIQKMLLSSLSTEKAKQKFVSNIVSLTSVKPELQECDYASIISGGLVAQSLDLPLSPSLGLAYLVPFNDKKKGKVAQFILGYKGYLQLAIRSGMYADIDVKEVKEGEYLGRDSRNGKPKFKFIEDDDEAEQLQTIGYMAYFEYANGFTKTLYWSKEKMLKHADQYSQAFSLNATKGKYPKVSYADYVAGNYPTEDEWKYSSFWYKNFTEMAFKTLLRQLISRWGLMSVELQKAFDFDTKQMESEEDDTVYTQEQAEQDFFGEDNTENISAEVETVVDEETGEVKPKSGRKKTTKETQEDFFGNEG